MKTVRIPSPARSQGAGPRTPIRHKHRRSLSVGSARSKASGRLTAIIQQNRHKASFVVSPLASRSILSDNTEIEEPRRKSWWKKLGENSRDVEELFEENKIVEPDNLIEELDIEILSQENKNYTMDLPESSDSESINSIVIPQRKLFTQKEKLPQKKFGQIIGTRETLAKHHKSHNLDKTISVAPRELFQNKLRTKPIFPATLLNLSPEKTNELTTVEPKAQVRNLFGKRATKRKNIFSNFKVSDSEDEIPEIQPRVFGFQQTSKARRRSSSRSVRKPSLESSIATDIEMEDWDMLPSSTMVEHQPENMGPNITLPSQVTEESEQLEFSKENSNRSIRGRKKSLAKDITKVKEDKSETNQKQIVQTNNLENSFESKNEIVEMEVVENKLQNNQQVDDNAEDDVAMHDNIIEEVEVPEQNEEEIEADKNEFLNESQEAQTEIDEEQNISHGEDAKSENEEQNKSDQINRQVDYNSEDDVVNDDKEVEDIEENEEEIEADENELLNESQEAQTEIDEEQNISHDEDAESENEEQNKSDQTNRQVDDNLENDVVNDDNIVEEVEDIEENEEEIEADENELLNESQEAQTEMDEEQNISHDEDAESENEEQYKSDQTNRQVDYNSEDDVVNDDNIVEEVEDIEENEEEIEADENELLNESQEAQTEIDEEQNISHDEDAESENEEQNKSDQTNRQVDDNSEDDVVNDDNTVEEVEDIEENEEEIEADENELLNESQEAEAEDTDEEQHESQEAEAEDTDEEQHTSQDEFEAIADSDNEIDEHNHSCEAEAENDEEQNISQEVEHDIVEQNKMEIVNQDESEVIADSDDDEPNNSQDDIADDSKNQDIDQIESGQEEEIESPNISHDTTGRNRKKNESPEVPILQRSSNHLDSFSLKGRNTSVRKTEMVNSMIIQPIIAPVRESTDFSVGNTNSSAEGSGWDSHRTTRKTLRQTLGRDFTLRKSLRALVMEKSAKRQTLHDDVASVTAKFPQANSTELPEMSNQYDDNHDSDEDEMTLEMCLENIRKENMEKRLRLEEAVRNSLNAPPQDHIFKVPAKPFFARRPKPTTIPKRTRFTPFTEELPVEIIEDMKYKPPKRFHPSNAGWITKRLYKYLETKLKPKYDYKARIRAERLVEHIYSFTKEVRRNKEAPKDSVEVLKREMAHLNIVKTHFEFYDFFHQFMPRMIRVKVIPDAVNNISVPKNGVFGDIL